MLDLVEKRMLPNYIIAGAQKAGTTAVFNWLKVHPDVFVPAIKEVHFFDREKEYANGIKYYEDFFDGWQGERVVLDITPNYLHTDRVSVRIKASLAEVKLIFILRNPVDRAFAQYWHNVRNETEKLDFLQAVKKNSVYIKKSLYSEQLLPFLQLFERSKVLFLLSERLFNQPKEFFTELCSFLNIPYAFRQEFDQGVYQTRQPRNKWLNKLMLSQSLMIRAIRKVTPAKLKIWLKILNKKNNWAEFSYPEIDSDTRKYLKNIFMDDIKKLQKQTGLNLNHWLE